MTINCIKNTHGVFESYVMDDHHNVLRVCGYGTTPDAAICDMQSKAAVIAEDMRRVADMFDTPTVEVFPESDSPAWSRRRFLLSKLKWI